MNRGRWRKFRDRILRPAALAVALGIVAGPVPVSAAVPDDPVLGLWMADSKKLLVEFYSCDEELCARIVWLAKSHNKSGELRRDRKNPNPDLRSRGWCGIEVIEGLKPKPNGAWENGDFYNPKDGSTYSIDVKPASGDRLKIRVYIVIRLLGKSETWSRPGDTTGLGCPAES